MACLSPGRRLGVVGRRRGFFLSGAVPQKIPVNLLPKSIGSSSRNWRGLPVKLCPTATLLLTVYESVPRRDFRSSKIAFVDFVKTACPQGVAFKGRGGRPIGVRGPTRIRFPVCTGTVSTNCLSPRENCLSPAPPRAVCRWGMASFDPGPMPRVCRHSRGPSREWRVFPHGVPIASPWRPHGVPMASPWRRRASQRIFRKRCSATKNSAEAFAKVNRLQFQKLTRVAGKIVSDSNAFAYGLRTVSSARGRTVARKQYRALTHRLCSGFPTALKHMQPQSEDFQNECRLTAAMLSIGRAPDDRYALKRCRYR